MSFIRSDGIRMPGPFDRFGGLIPGRSPTGSSFRYCSPAGSSRPRTPWLCNACAGSPYGERSIRRRSGIRLTASYQCQLASAARPSPFSAMARIAVSCTSPPSKRPVSPCCSIVAL